MAVVCDNAGDYGDTGLDGQVEGALLEGEQHGLLGVAAGALGEHVDALALGLDLVGGALHGLAGVLCVLAVDEDGAAQGHEPAEEGRLLERGLCRDAAVLGEHGAQHEDVELGLVVPDEDGRARGAEDVARVLDDELDARGQEHGVLEAPAGGPLGDALPADEGEEDGDEDAVEGGQDERDVRGQAAGDEAGLGDHHGEGVEEDGEGSVAREEGRKEARGGHGGCGGGGRSCGLYKMEDE